MPFTMSLHRGTLDLGLAATVTAQSLTRHCSRVGVTVTGLPGELGGLHKYDGYKKNADTAIESFS